MGNVAVVSPIAEGSARATEVRSMPWSGGGLATPNSMHIAKGGGASINLMSQSSNWGLSGPTYSSALVNGGWGQSLQAGTIGWDMRVPLMTTKPGQAFTHPRGLFVWEMLLAWDATSTSNTENGFILTWQAIGSNKPITGGNQGIVVGRQAAGMRVTFVGGATTTTDVATTITDWNKIRVEIRNATKTTEASIAVYINDLLAISRDATAASFPLAQATPNMFLNASLGVNHATATLYWRDMSYWDGPNQSAALGM